MGTINRIMKQLGCGSGADAVAPQRQGKAPIAIPEARIVQVVAKSVIPSARIIRVVPSPAIVDNAKKTVGWGVNLEPQAVKDFICATTFDEVVDETGLLDAFSVPFKQWNGDHNKMEQWDARDAYSLVKKEDVGYRVLMQHRIKEGKTVPGPFVYITVKASDYAFIFAYLKHKREGTLSQNWEKFDKNFTSALDSLTVTDHATPLYRGMKNIDMSTMVEGEPYSINQATYSSPFFVNAMLYAGIDVASEDTSMKGKNGVVMSIFHPDKAAPLEPLGDTWQTILPAGQELTTLFKHEFSYEGKPLAMAVLTGANSGDKGSQAHLVDALTLASSSNKRSTIDN